MRSRVGIYIRESEEPRRYLTPHTKNSYAIIDGQPVYVRRGTYHLRYRKGGKQVWERVPGDYKVAKFLQRKREAEFLTGVIGGPEPETSSEANSPLESTILIYLAKLKDRDKSLSTQVG
jgi:hypothetical protein